MKRTLHFLTFLLPIILLSGTLVAQSKIYTNTFPLESVQITAGPFKHALDLNLNVLLRYDTDRLLAPYLREAGLEIKKQSYGNWESDGLDGHIGGHYLSAIAIHYAATGNKECKKRLDYMVSELNRCQQSSKNGKGYIGGVPVEKIQNGKTINLWKELRKGNQGVVWSYWVPWYNLHKTYAGLRDAWLYGQNKVAKQMFLDLCDWGIELISNLDEKQMEAMLSNEFGGMNEVYADAFQLTHDNKYLDAAKRFSHKFLFDSMAKKIDNLDNLHANTQVPKAVGYQRVAELSGDTDYTVAAEFFWETVTSKRSLSLGGNSRSEHFPEPGKYSDYIHERQGPETCNTYNMLKLTEGLFRMNPEAKYADYYERAMYNHILSTQHPEHGGYVYFTPACPSHYRVYSSPEKSMWCCVGTGMENHGKYGQFIYTHSPENDALYVNLFVPSELKWKDKKTVIKQITDFPNEEGSKLIVNVSKTTKFKLRVRHPWWSDNMQVWCNGVNYAIDSKPGSYIEIDRSWKKGDLVELKMPMKVTVEELPNVPNEISILRGPILLGAKTNTDKMPGLIAGAGRWEHIAHGALVSALDAPSIIGKRDDILAKLNNMKPVSGKPFTYTAPDLFADARYKNLIFEPFYKIHDSRYMMYWLSMTEDEFEQYKKDKGEEEREKLVLDQRTVDMVASGQQQPEADHAMQAKQSHRGAHQGESWRDARNEGFFQYTMSTKNEQQLSLMVRYWGNESGNRSFDIYIDEQLIVSENIEGKWNKQGFVNVEYQIPETFIKGKAKITVKFQSKTESTAGGVFAVRLLKSI